jgi:glycosyltransferase involved in cell wall biosynthesis
MPDAGYQENYLVIGQKEIGNIVYIITSKYEWNFQINMNNREYNYGTYDYYGVKVIRIPILLEIKNRFVVFKNLYKYLEYIKPDMIFYHDHSPELLNCIRYVKKNPETRLVIDIHSTLENSMHSIFGGVYHKLLWRNIIKKIQKYYHKVFYIAPECKTFAIRIYKINENKLELLPLPGDASLMKDYHKIRKRIREKLNITENEKIIFHTGKLPGQKYTLNVLEAFCEIDNVNYWLYLIGSIEESFLDTFNYYLNRNKRIKFLGWLKPDEMRELFIAGDLLLQPGSLSNSFIDAICCGLPLILKDTPQGKYLTKNNNGILLKDQSRDSIKKAVEYILKEKNLAKYKESALMSYDEFHYTNIAWRSVV